MTRPVRADARRGADLPPAPLPTLAADIVLPLRTYSEANGSHGHWAARARRTKVQRTTARLALLPLLLPHLNWRVPVTAFTRTIGPRALVTVAFVRYAPSTGLDDEENLRVAIKHVKDGVADALGLLDDSDERVFWEYGQVDSRALVRAGVAPPELVRGYGLGVRVTVERRVA